MVYKNSPSPKIMPSSQPDVRRLYDIREVLYDQKWLKGAKNIELYYMYRGVDCKDNLRYDLTVIPFQMLGAEFVKTKGHEHPGDYAELYEVLEGQAIFLMQKHNKGKIKDVYFVEAKKGDKVFIPKRYGHVTINPGPCKLKMSNWVAKSFSSDYSLFSENHGACYYALTGKSKVKWIKNNNYGDVPELRFEKPNKNIPKDLKKALTG